MFLEKLKNIKKVKPLFFFLLVFEIEIIEKFEENKNL